MPTVTFITLDGTHKTIENAIGSLMEIAQDNEIEGITGDCGGVCSCSTCHVYVAPDWWPRISPAESAEIDTLEFSDHCSKRSRLCCQIELTDALDGLVVEVAAEG